MLSTRCTARTCHHPRLTLDTPCRAGHNQADRSGGVHAQTIRAIAGVAPLLQYLSPVDAGAATAALDPSRRRAVRLPLPGLLQFRRLQDRPRTGGPIPEGRLAAAPINRAARRGIPPPTPRGNPVPSGPLP